jgi:flavin-dependent dehydrogenase
METPPTHADVVVVGAGPAGSACAHRLAAAGHDVLLIDQHRFPRDKVCGDGLIPDAHAALRRLGVLDAVMARAQRVRHVRCIGTRGRTIDVPGTLAVLPRRELDELLFRNACEAGARPLVPARFEEPLVDGERVAGVRLKVGDALHDVSARWVVLATGAAGGPLEAAGVCDRRVPSGVAIRGYVKNDAMVGRITELEIRWHPRLKGGYGWIFPAPGGVFNIGTGITGLLRAPDGEGGASGGKLLDVNLRRMFETFLEVPVELKSDGPSHVLATVAGKATGFQAAKIEKSEAKAMRVEIIDATTIAMRDPKKGRLVYTKE